MSSDPSDPPGTTKRLRSDSSAYALAFQPPTDGGLYGAAIASGVLDALEELKFSGGLEVGGMDNPLSGMYVLMLAPSFAKKPRDTYLWWKTLQAAVAKASLNGSEFVESFCEITTVGVVRAQVPTYAVLFSAGLPTRILVGTPDSSWFLAEAARRIAAV